MLSPFSKRLMVMINKAFCSSKIKADGHTCGACVHYLNKEPMKDFLCKSVTVMMSQREKESRDAL